MQPILKFPNYFITSTGKIWSTYKKGRWLKVAPDGRGYLQVTLVRNGTKHRRRIHRLVLETFVGSCPKEMEGCHNNGNRADNQLNNLRWDTRRNNTLDTVKHGTYVLMRGETNGRAKLKRFQIYLIRNLLKIGALTQREIGIMFDVTQNTISRIKQRNLWGHI